MIWTFLLFQISSGPLLGTRNWKHLSNLHQVLAGWISWQTVILVLGPLILVLGPLILVLYMQNVPFSQLNLLSPTSILCQKLVLMLMEFIDNFDDLFHHFRDFLYKQYAYFYVKMNLCDVWPYILKKKKNCEALLIVIKTFKRYCTYYLWPTLCCHSKLSPMH